MENSIGWINGKWGALNELMLPISDRGVTLADGIFETILISEGKPRLFKEHLLRWKNSANALSMNQPPSEEWLNPLVAEGIGFILRNNASGVLRLNWSRGISLNRGIDIDRIIHLMYGCNSYFDDEEMLTIDLSFQAINTNAI